MGEILERMKALLVEPENQPQATNPDFLDFTRCVLAAMGLPITRGGKRIAQERGVDFRRLYDGGTVYPDHPSHCWRAVMGKQDDGCKACKSRRACRQQQDKFDRNE